MTRVRVLEKGVFACFDAGLADDDGEPVNAEISAIAWDGHRMVLASDKNIPGAERSPVFSIDCANGRPVAESRRFYTADLIRNAQKYEDFALTVAGGHLIAATGFDRVERDTADLDVYNRLLVWPVDDPDSPRVIGAHEREGVVSSLAVREGLCAAVDAPYLKVEGLATIPAPDGGDDRLLFGIREIGRAHDDFDYACCVVSVAYRMDGDVLELTGDFERLYDFDPGRWPEIRFTVGLSSLEYDPLNHRLYFLTSFEVEDEAGEQQVGAYIWQMGLDAFAAGQAPELIRAVDGSAFEFANKAEGVAVLEDGRLFVVYDPDRDMSLDAGHERDAREPHEAPYTLLGVE